MARSLSSSSLLRLPCRRKEKKSVRLFRGSYNSARALESALETSDAAPEGTWPAACLAARSCVCPAQEEKRLPLAALVKEQAKDEIDWEAR